MPVSRAVYEVEKLLRRCIVGCKKACEFHILQFPRRAICAFHKTLFPSRPSQGIVAGIVPKGGERQKTGELFNLGLGTRKGLSLWLKEGCWRDIF